MLIRTPHCPAAGSKNGSGQLDFYSNRQAADLRDADRIREKPETKAGLKRPAKVNLDLNAPNEEQLEAFDSR
jgi:hypothetical protein